MKMKKIWRNRTEGAGREQETKEFAVILTTTDDSNKLDEAGEKAKTSHSDTIP